MSLTDTYIFNILKLIITFLFICRIYLFILYIYLIHLFNYSFIIIRRPPSAVRIHRPFVRFTNSCFTVKYMF